MIQHLLLATGAIALLCACAEADSISVIQSRDRSVTVTTPTYTAQIDSLGNLTHLTVKGAATFGHKFGNPGNPPKDAPTVNVHNRIVAVRSGDMRVEWTFGESSIHVLTEGYTFEAQLDPSVKAVVTPDGKGGPATSIYGGSSAIVLANDLTVSYSMLLHAGAGRVVPTCYVNGSGVNFGDLIEFDLTLGNPVEAVQMLSSVSLKSIGDSYGSLHDDGNQGSGIIHFPASTEIAFESSQQNIGSQPMKIDYRLSAVDHQVDGKEVVGLSQKAELIPGSPKSLSWKVPKLAPGFYYLTVSAWKGGKKLTDTKLTFAVDLEHYAHPLTRPKDFEAFWDRQNKKLADSPMNAKATLISSPENPDKAYEVYLDMPDGSKVHGCLEVPAKIGKGPAQFGSLVTHALADLMTNTKKPEYHAADHVRFTISLPEEATYTTWKSRENNNLLACILVSLRAVDYLASRPEVDPKRIVANGASRTGGITLILAALRPGNICAANGHVHTSCGISWTDEPYLGWGKCPDPKKPRAMKKFCAEAAYVDPVNFAPDVKCPAVLAYGIDDVFSPPQGIETAYHLLGSSWKRISRDGGGHQYSPGFQKIAAEMFAVLDAPAGSSPDQSTTLKQH